MRPLLIKLSAFGPYADETTIDMEKLGSQGLYLVTGDTGAGKTTIFDAICYALYGEASGTNREVTMLRSQYAKIDTPTFVELVFLHMGKQYRICRNPEYERPKNRGEGTTRENAKAELFMPDGTVISKANEVTKKVIDILGINKDQFAQIAMIAQGDFMKLLLADTSTRIKIFRELFKTSYYQKLQWALDEEKKKISGIVLDGRKSVRQYVSGIAVNENDVLKIEVDKVKSDELTIEAIFELLEKLIEQDDESKRVIDEELASISEKISAINIKIGVAETIEKAKQDLEIVGQQLAVEIEQMEKLKENLRAAQKDMEKKEELNDEAASINAELEVYDEYDKLVSDITKNEKSIIVLREKFERQSAETDKVTIEMQRLKDEQVTLKDAKANMERLKAEKEKAETKLESVKELSSEYGSYVLLSKKVEEAQSVYFQASEKHDELQRFYDKLDKALRDGRAGVIAASLKDGDICPVCGGVFKTEKAPAVKDIPSEDAVENARINADEAREFATACSLKAQTAKGLAKSKAEDLKKAGKKVLDCDDVTQLEELAQNTAKTLNLNIKEISEELSKEQEKENRRIEIEERIPELENRKTELSESVNQVKTDIGSLESVIKTQKMQAETDKKRLKFDGKEAAVAKIRQLRDEADKLQKTYESAQKAEREKSELVNGLRAQINTYEEQIKNVKVYDLETEQKEREMLLELQSQNIDKGQTVAARLTTNKGIRENISLQAKSIALTEKKLQWVANLSDTANGNLKGKDKVMLETYIQTAYFDRIIQRANSRLMKMSGAQYELRRWGEASHGNSKSGLELGVIDHYNGSERSVKTLSGGESFMASLSLALGLSDEVQASAGGIQIDTMFVDEGFGSLDSDALDKAYQALAGLTEGNKLVGIISHVAELKEKIDKQIVVTKAKSGGSFVKVVV